MKTHKLVTTEADTGYDVHGPLPPADGRPPLFMIGQPMAASGFSTLASYFPDRTVITYDPRGLGRSVRNDGRVDTAPTGQAADAHAVIEALGVGPVEMFASSGGAITALALVAAYPNDVTCLVAHEPPLLPVLPDAQAAERARAGVREAYEAKGSDAGMAAFIAMTSWLRGFAARHFARPAPAPPPLRSTDDASHLRRYAGRRMSSYDAAPWQNFYVVVGGAAAALTGLLFVAMSLHSKAIIAPPLYGTRAVGTLLSLMTQLFVAGTVLIPQSTMALGIEVEVAAILSVIQTVRAVVVTLGTAERQIRSRMSTALEAIVAAIWIVLFVA